VKAHCASSSKQMHHFVDDAVLSVQGKIGDLEDSGLEKLFGDLLPKGGNLVHF
jgi:hypothetical protein